MSANSTLAVPKDVLPFKHHQGDSYSAESGLYGYTASDAFTLYLRQRDQVQTITGSASGGP